MEKPAKLREHLEERLPELVTNPERLRLWIDKGSVQTQMTDSLAYRTSYTLQLVVTDWARPVAILTLLIIVWLRQHQPDLIATFAAAGFSFEADILDSGIVDIAFDLPLTESVGVAATPGGGWTLEHHAEPAALFPDDLPLTDPAHRLVGATAHHGASASQAAVPFDDDSGGPSWDAMAMVDALLNPDA